MDKIIKGKKYIAFGNFPDAEGLATRLSDSLGVECMAFMSNTDNVSFVEYAEEDSEVVKLNEELNKEYNNITLKNKEIGELSMRLDKLNSEYDYRCKEFNKLLDTNTDLDIENRKLRKELKSKWF